MYVSRVMDILANRLGRLTLSGGPPTAENAKFFLATSYEPDAEDRIGRAWPTVLTVEPAATTGKTGLTVTVGLIFDRSPLCTSITNMYKLISPDNPFGMYRMLTTERLNEGIYSSVDWPDVNDPESGRPIPGSGDWQYDALSPPKDVSYSAEPPHPIDVANFGYRYTFDMTGLGSSEGTEFAETNSIIVVAEVDVTAIQVKGIASG